ncbi:MAG: hypothetical protein KIT84_40325 [Labilithrix sp.]|nr:hypothetical protein [Labilithrix sp.]MCW5817314.1 hypothetical protein [Labilithrix sp.]
MKVEVVGLFVVAGLTALAACKGGTAPKPIAVPASSASADGGAPASFATTPPPSGLPAMASMPPPGVAGSKKAKVKADGALLACGGQTSAQAKDPAALVKKIGEGCAASSKMKPVGALLRGTQADKDAHQDQKFRAEANHCYRVYFATDESVKDVVVVLRDSAGDVVAEAPGPSAPQGGAACFTAADEVTLTVGVGSGKGAWAAQVWSD